MARYNPKRMLIGIIGDEDTTTGFLLAGIGDRNRTGKRNFLVVNSDTTLSQIEKGFKELTGRKDIGILLINQHIAEEIRHLLTQYDQKLPTILEIPSKNQLYDPDKDDVMIRVKKLLGK
eukprot:26305_1